MTSKISYFKIALDDLRHRFWMIALSCLGSLLALPILFLYANGHYMASYERIQKTSSIEKARTILFAYYMHFFKEYTLISCAFILFIGALIVGLFGFRYLYSKKMVDLYHSMPIKRHLLFLIHYIDGFLIWFVPMMISWLLTLILLFGNMASTGITEHLTSTVLPVVWKNIGICILSFLTVYHFAVFCVMLCGNAFNAIVLTILGGGLVIGLDALDAIYKSIYLETYVAPSVHYTCFSWASPLVNAIILLLPPQTVAAPSRALYLCLSILMILITFIGAILLYIRRPSELAEHGIDNKPTRNILRVIVSIAAGLILGGIFIAIEDRFAYGWILFGTVFGSVLAFGILNVILNMDFKAFLKNKALLVCAVLIACILPFVYRFDLIGYNSQLPKQSRIDKVILMDGNKETWQYNDLSGDSDGFYQYADYTQLYALLETLTDKAHTDLAEQTDSSSFYVRIKCKNGSEFQRRYDILAEDLEQLRPLLEDPVYRDATYPISSGLLGTPSRIQVRFDEIGSMDMLENPDDCKELMDAYVKDFKDNYSLERSGVGIAVCSINCCFDTINEGIYSDYLPVYATYSRTISILSRFYKDSPLSFEHLNADDLEIDVDFAKEAGDRDALYSYFGLEGYPLLAPDITSPNLVHDTYQLTLDSPEDLEAIAPYLMIGTWESGPLSSIMDDQYIYVGKASYGNHQRVSCFVKSGEFPREWIDRLELISEEKINFDYDEY